jgi:hypothetical protein
MWGTGITVFIILFMSFILYMVYLTTQNPIDLVEKDYYPKGLVYQERIEEIKNGNSVKDEFVIKQTENEVVVKLPEIKNPDTSNITVFRPSDKRLDISNEIVEDDSNAMHFPLRKFRKGKYIVKVFWKKDGKGYYMEKVFFFN